MTASLTEKQLLRWTLHLDCPAERLTPDCREILERYGSWMQGLCAGKFEPYTPAQQQFLDMHRGLTSPQTRFEHAWYEYRIECLYAYALYWEPHLGGASPLSYHQLVKVFQELANTGHPDAHYWLQNEGELPPALPLQHRFPPMPLHRTIQGSLRFVRPRSSKYTMTGKPAAVSDAGGGLDWGEGFDDLDGAFWETYLGGPDAD